MFVFGSAYLRHIMSQLIGKCKGKRPCVYDFDNFIVGINFFQGLWGCLKYFWKFRRGGGGGGLIMSRRNGNSGEVKGFTRNSLRGGGMDLFWNHTIEKNASANFGG